MSENGFCAVCGSIDRLSPGTAIRVRRVDLPNRVITIHRRCFNRDEHQKVDDEPPRPD